MLQRLEQFRSKRIGIIVDDSADSVRCVVVVPAQHISIETINSLFTITGGLPFVAISPERAAAFMLGEMARPRMSNSDFTPADTRQLLSVEAREGVSTGISASDRATTVKILGDEHPNPRLLVKPGHIFPVEVRTGGILVKCALPEGALDLARIGGFSDAALYLDLLSPDGSFSNLVQVNALAKERDIPIFPLSDLVRYRLESESLVERVAEANLPTRLAGELRSIMYRSKIHAGEHIALIKGDLSSAGAVLARVQPENTFTDVFGGKESPSRSILQKSLSAIGKRGKGVLVYLRRPNAGALREQLVEQLGHRPHPNSMMREYGLGAQILRDLGIKQIELMTGSKKNLVGLKTFGIEIVAQHSIPD